MHKIIYTILFHNSVRLAQLAAHLTTDREVAGSRPVSDLSFSRSFLGAALLRQWF